MAALRATVTVLYYFEGINSDQMTIQRTVPLIYRPTTDASGQPTFSAAMALPTSVFPNPARAPQPGVDDDVPEAFPPQRFAAAAFTTPAPATDADFAAACGEAAKWLRRKGIKPVTTGVWAVAWVTYSRLRDPEHNSECWLSVAA